MTTQNGDALLGPFTQVSTYMLSFIDSMTLRCAVELRIPDVVVDHGDPISLSQLQTAINVPDVKVSALRRLMRVLVLNGLVGATGSGDDGAEEWYAPTELCRMAVKQRSLALLCSHETALKALLSLSSWLRDGDGAPATAYRMGNQCSAWEFICGDAEMNKLFNDGMAADSTALITALVSNGGHAFRGLKSLVDVGGGTGTTARAIAENFHVKCAVLDRPNVVDNAPKDGVVEFIAGDMFVHIPKANAVLFKSVLHDWNDDDCVKALRRAKEAIPGKEEGGKVIIIDIIVDVNSAKQQAARNQLYVDTMMMAIYGGEEREEGEWKRIFDKAGFSGYKKSPLTDIFSLLEVYP